MYSDNPASAFILPNGFVYVKDIDPTIQINLKYAGPDNFLGKTVDGYFNPKAAILTKQAAIALSNAQTQFNKQGFSIVIYDAYRPQQAVEHFVNWTQEPDSQDMKQYFYPRINKNLLLNDGYLAEHSSHSRGSTVDVTIISLQQQLSINAVPSMRKLQDGGEIYYLNDGTIDMGTSFDLFDQASHYESQLTTIEHKKNREYLRNVMESYGFYGVSEEWWHFTLKNEPHPNKYWNFAVQF